MEADVSRERVLEVLALLWIYGLTALFFLLVVLPRLSGAAG